MDVIALVGPSGTGKSHRALLVAHKHQADAIIDDGILIKDGKIVGGHSAKKEKSRIMAVRRTRHSSLMTPRSLSISLGSRSRPSAQSCRMSRQKSSVHRCGLPRNRMSSRRTTSAPSAIRC